MSGLAKIPRNDYHADKLGGTPSLSSGTVRTLIASSPLHAWTDHPRLNPDYMPREEEKFDIGTVAHSMLLEGASAVCVVDAADWRTKVAQETRDQARRDGLVPLLAKHWDAVQAMVNAAAVQLAAFDADPIPFTAGQPEQCLTWEEDGILCRALVDWLHDDHAAIDDYKTTSRTANPEQWSRTMFSGYDVQAAWYLRGLRAVTGADAEFRFVVQETYPPYALSIVAPSPAALALANDKVDYALVIWKRCLAEDRWPAYPARVAYAEPPSWAEAQWLEKEAREEVTA